MTKIPEEIKKEILEIKDPYLRKELVKATELLANLRIKIARLPGAIGGKTLKERDIEKIGYLSDICNGVEYIGKVLENAENYKESDINRTINYLKKGKLTLESTQRNCGLRKKT